MLSPYKKNLEKPLIKLFQTTNINPNIVTLLGIIPALLFLVFMIQHNYLLAIITFIGNGLDFIDGLIARSQNKVTNFGGFLDSLVDRAVDGIIIASFSFANLVSWQITFPFLLISFLISYSRSRGELSSLGKVSFNVGIMERTERLIGILVSLIVYLIFPNSNLISLMFILMVIFSTITLYQRIIFAKNKL